MSSLSLLLQHDIARLFPAFGAHLTAVFLAAVIIMEVVGPVAVQYGLKLSGETLPETEDTVVAKPNAP
jgi:hypothetical protein